MPAAAMASSTEASKSCSLRSIDGASDALISLHFLACESVSRELYKLGHSYVSRSGPKHQIEPLWHAASILTRKG